MPTKNRTTYVIVIFCPNYTVRNSGQNNATTIKNSLARKDKSRHMLDRPLNSNTIKNSGQHNATTIKNSLAEMSKDNMWA